MVYGNSNTAPLKPFPSNRTPSGSSPATNLTVADSPGFSVRFIGLAELNAAFLMKAAHAAVGWIGVQEIRVKPFFGVNGYNYTLKSTENRNGFSRRGLKPSKLTSTS